MSEERNSDCEYSEYEGKRIYYDFDAFSDGRVLQCSRDLYDEYKSKYLNEINEICTAHLRIQPPNTELSDHQIANKINFWSHCMQSDLLNMIFEWVCYSRYDKPPQTHILTLMLVCKKWRLLCLKNDTLFIGVVQSLCYGNLNSFGTGMTWKKLIVTPSRYLKYFEKYYIEDMTNKECEAYKLLVEDYDDSMKDIVPQTNVFLTIQCLRHLRNTIDLYLTGTLSDDLFYAIGKYGNNMQSLEISFVENGDNLWFRHLGKKNSVCMDRLSIIKLERSYWINDDCLKWLGKLGNLQWIDMDRLFNVTGKGLQYLFEGNNGKKLESVRLSRGLQRNIGVKKAIQLIAQNAKTLIDLDLSECIGFDNECLKLLHDKDACPQLECLNIMYTSCTAKQVKIFQNQRPNVSVQVE